MPVLKGNVHFNKYDVSDTLAYNIQERLKYGFLEFGAFTNIDASGTYGTLERTSSRVFEGIGPGWVWESGVSTVNGSTAPFPVSGIYFNNTWTPVGTNASGTGYTSSWYVDYRNGRIIFSSGTATSAVVKCSYSGRDVGVYLSDSTEFKTIMTELERRYSSLDTLQPSGMASYFKENRVWLPAVFITLGQTGSEGYQLGGGEIQEFNVIFSVFSDRPFSAKKIADILSNQFQTTIDLFNPNTAPFPLRYNGSLSGSGISYDQLGTRTSPYFWAYSRVTDVNSDVFASDLAEDLYRAEISWRVGVERPAGTY